MCQCSLSVGWRRSKPDPKRGPGPTWQTPERPGFVWVESWPAWSEVRGEQVVSESRRPAELRPCHTGSVRLRK